MLHFEKTRCSGQIELKAVKYATNKKLLLLNDDASTTGCQNYLILLIFSSLIKARDLLLRKPFRV